MKKITAFAIAALALTGCFKKVTNDTTFVIKPVLQTESGGEMAMAEGVTAYACYVGEEWSVGSYDDAVAQRITDTATGEEKQGADVESQTGEDGMLRLHTTRAHVMLVAVYEAGEMYAWRHYDTGENLPQTYMTIQFRTWKNDPYNDSGWSVGLAPREPEGGETGGEGSGSEGSEGEGGEGNEGDGSGSGSAGGSGSEDGSGSEGEDSGSPSVNDTAKAYGHER